MPRLILPTMSMWQFWATETLQKRLSNASGMLQQRSTSGLHLLLDVLIYCGSFHGEWKALWGTTSACASVRAWQQPCATANPGPVPPYRLLISYLEVHSVLKLSCIERPTRSPVWFTAFVFHGRFPAGALPG
jgi:hypothetical protein